MSDWAVTAAIAGGQFLLGLFGAALGGTWALHRSHIALLEHIDKKQKEVRDEMAERARVFQDILNGLRLDISAEERYSRENIGRLGGLIARLTNGSGNGK